MQEVDLLMASCMVCSSTRVTRVWGVIKLKYYAYDTKTWQLIDQPVEVNDLSLTATETAVDPVTGEIFGEFYAPDLNGHEWGVIDYTTLKRTTIAPAQHVYEPWASPMTALHTV